MQNGHVESFHRRAISASTGHAARSMVGGCTTTVNDRILRSAINPEERVCLHRKRTLLTVLTWFRRLGVWPCVVAPLRFGIYELLVIVLGELEVSIDIAATETEIQDSLLCIVCGREKHLRFEWQPGHWIFTPPLWQPDLQEKDSREATPQSG